MIAKAAFCAAALAQAAPAFGVDGCARLAEAVVVMEAEARRAMSVRVHATPDHVLALAAGLRGVACPRRTVEALFAASPLGVAPFANGPSLALALCAAPFWFGVSVDADGVIESAWAGAPKSLDGTCPLG